MKIALLTDGIYPYAIGGMQKHSFQLAKELAGNKCTVYLFHCNESSFDASKLEFFTEEERKYIKSFVIPFPHKTYFPLHYLYESHLYSKFIYEALTPHLPEIDFVFAQGFCAWELLKHKKEVKPPPILVHFHGLEMFQNIPSIKAKLTNIFLKPAVKKNIQLADYTISFGGKITTMLQSIVPKEKIWEIPGSIDKLWLSENTMPVKDAVRFVFVGRYERRKGLPELNKAINTLSSSAKFSFEFIGDIPDSHKINSSSVKYHSKVTSEDKVKEILSNNDVLVCPSFAEGMPIVIMEAMAQSLAIIATDVGSVSTLVNEQNGWLLKSPDPSAISNAMLDAINNKESLSSKKENSRKKIAKGFLTEQVTKNLLEKIEASKKILSSN
ncbi:MAG TPA: glycosyltransferase family 4 protein [Bacteroidia bacterium]|nr:glycosyltransferase family 4 protein [Bacteroidia bacterium]